MSIVTMQRRYILCIGICLIVNNFAYNLDTNNPIIYTDPSQKSHNNSNYFGYSVILYRGSTMNKSWWVKKKSWFFHSKSSSWWMMIRCFRRVLVGAPRGSDPNETRHIEPGVVWRCGILGGKCEIIELPLDKTGK